MLSDRRDHLFHGGRDAGNAHAVELSLDRVLYRCSPERRLVLCDGRFGEHAMHRRKRAHR